MKRLHQIFMAGLVIATAAAWQMPGQSMVADPGATFIAAAARQERAEDVFLVVALDPTKPVEVEKLGKPIRVVLPGEPTQSVQVTFIRQPTPADSSAFNVIIETAGGQSSISAIRLPSVGFSVVDVELPNGSKSTIYTLRRLVTPYNGCQFPIDPLKTGGPGWGMLSFDFMEYSSNDNEFLFAIEVLEDVKINLKKATDGTVATITLKGPQDPSSGPKAHFFKSSKFGKLRAPRVVKLIGDANVYWFLNETYVSNEYEETISIYPRYHEVQANYVAEISIEFGPIQSRFDVRK